MRYLDVALIVHNLCNTAPAILHSTRQASSAHYLSYDMPYKCSVITSGRKAEQFSEPRQSHKTITGCASQRPACRVVAILQMNHGSAGRQGAGIWNIVQLKM